MLFRQVSGKNVLMTKLSPTGMPPTSSAAPRLRSRWISLFKLSCGMMIRSIRNLNKMRATPPMTNHTPKVTRESDFKTELEIKLPIAMSSSAKSTPADAFFFLIS